MKRTLLAASLLAVIGSSAHATNQIVDAGGVGAQIIDPVTGQVDGVVSISAGEPDNAVITLTVGSSCNGVCNLSTMYVGFVLDAFASYPRGPACQATLHDGYLHFVGNNISRADPWPIGTTFTVDYDPGFFGSNIYYVRVDGPPKTALDNPTNPPAAVFVPGRQLRINVACAPK